MIPLKNKSPGDGILPTDILSSDFRQDFLTGSEKRGTDGCIARRKLAKLWYFSRKDGTYEIFHFDMFR